MKLFGVTTGILALLNVVQSNLTAQADQFPSRTIRFIVPYQAAGTTDIVTRVVAQKLTERWGRSVIVENRPGGNGLIAISQVAAAEPDGYTLLSVASSRLTLTSATSRKQVDFGRDFAPITRIGFVPNVVVVHPSLPVTTIPELIALAKAKPGALAYGSQSIGSNGHVTAELFQQRAGVRLTHIPYKGSAPAVQDLLAGHIQIMFDNLPTVLAAIKSGQLRALAVTTAQRSDALPEVPTVEESGLPGFDTSAWFAVTAPKAVPSAIRTEIENAIIAVLAIPEVRSRLKTAGIDAVADGSAALIKRIREESSMWDEVLTKGNIKLE
jgi:tripartite-type tricarboxylate transporter receptor subunit TctC